MTLSACAYFPPDTNTHLAQLVPPPNPVGNHYINKLLWTLITIIDVSVQWNVRLICKLRLGGWAPRFLPPIPQCRREVTPRVPLRCGRSSFSGGWRAPPLWGWGCTILDRLVGAPPKPFCCLGEESWLSLRWLFSLLQTSSQLCLSTRSVIINSLIIHLLYCCTNKTVISPI